VKRVRAEGYKYRAAEERAERVGAERVRAERSIGQLRSLRGEPLRSHILVA
jgi:hypothetical protein